METRTQPERDGPASRSAVARLTRPRVLQLSIVSALLGVFGLGWTTLIWGNGGPIREWGGNSIMPLRRVPVRLVRETVRVDLTGRKTVAHCSYDLFNESGRDTTIEMAFVRGSHEGQKLRAWVRGQPVEVRWAAPANGYVWRRFTESDTDLLPVWSISFAAAETVQVRCEYPVSTDTGTTGRSFYKSFTYRTKAAALWSGTIESAEFVIELGDEARLVACTNILSPPYTVGHVQPDGYNWVGSSLRWSFRDWVPREDLVVSYESSRILSPDQFLGFQALSSADGEVPLRLITSHPSESKLDRLSVLQNLRRAFRRQGAGELIRPNYHAFALAYLRASRFEILLRNGRSVPSSDWRDRTMHELGMGDFVGPWNPHLSDEELNEFERFNLSLLSDLENLVVADMRSLLPLR